MNYRTLGKTGLRVSALGCGGSSLGGVFGAIDESEGIRAVHLAIERGINFFDTAPYYGETRAERVLGRALRGIDRREFIVGTKVGRYGVHDFDFRGARVIRSVDESLERLGLDYVDLVQAHDVEFGSVDQIVQETIPALRRVVESGKARFIGISGLPLRLLAEIAGKADLDIAQTYCHGTLYDSTVVEWLPIFARHQMGCINSAPLGMGLLTEQGPPSWHPAPLALREACARAAEYCRSLGCSVVDLALHHSAHLPGVHVTVVGMTRCKDVVANLRAIETAPDPNVLEQVRKILAPVQNLTWPSGRENQPCA